MLFRSLAKAEFHKIRAAKFGHSTSSHNPTIVVQSIQCSRCHRKWSCRFGGQTKIYSPRGHTFGQQHSLTKSSHSPFTASAVSIPFPLLSFQESTVIRIFDSFCSFPVYPHLTGPSFFKQQPFKITMKLRIDPPCPGTRSCQSSPIGNLPHHGGTSRLRSALCGIQL